MTRAELDTLAHRVSNWGRWGPEDERGTMNFVTPEVVRRACDWATDPDGFEARHFPVRVPGKVLELVANDVHDVEEDAPS